MKKLILSVTALAACSVGAYAQGYVYIDSSSATSPNGLVSINGVLDTTTDINLELLSSATQNGTYTEVAALLLSQNTASSSDGAVGFDSSDIQPGAGDITFYKNGQITDKSGNGYATATAGAYWFEVAAWTGNGVNSLPSSSPTEAVGITSAFQETTALATSQVLTTLNNMPALNLVTTAVPEPSTLAMAGVGLASMLIFRRRNK
jgi:hypothetical protein